MFSDACSNIANGLSALSEYELRSLREHDTSRCLLPCEHACDYESRRGIHTFDLLAAIDAYQVPGLVHVRKERGPGAVRVHGIGAGIVNRNEQAANAEGVSARNRLLSIEGKNTREGTWDEVVNVLRCPETQVRMRTAWCNLGNETREV